MDSWKMGSGGPGQKLGSTGHLGRVFWLLCGFWWCEPDGLRLHTQLPCRPGIRAGPVSKASFRMTSWPFLLHQLLPSSQERTFHAPAEVATLESWFLAPSAVPAALYNNFVTICLSFLIPLQSTGEVVPLSSFEMVEETGIERVSNLVKVTERQTWDLTWLWHFTK